MKNLNELALRYRSDKADTGHAYTYLYDLIFHEYRNRPINLLEIGLAVGGPELGGPADRRVTSPSVQMWLDYFSRAHIFGFDISDFSHHEHPRFTFVRGDCGQEEDLARIANRAPYFDVIIDDASHASYHQQLALKTLFPRVASEGLYIIEDLHWQSPFFEDKLPSVPKTSDFFAKFLRDDKYVENPLFSEEYMTEFKSKLHSFAIFPDFLSGSWLKMLVFRLR